MWMWLEAGDQPVIGVHASATRNFDQNSTGLLEQQRDEAYRLVLSHNSLLDRQQRNVQF